MTVDHYYELHERMIRAIERIANTDRYWAVNRAWYRWAERHGA